MIVLPTTAKILIKTDNFSVNKDGLNILDSCSDFHTQNWTLPASQTTSKTTKERWFPLKKNVENPFLMPKGWAKDGVPSAAFPTATTVEVFGAPNYALNMYFFCHPNGSVSHFV